MSHKIQRAMQLVDAAFNELVAFDPLSIRDEFHHLPIDSLKSKIILAIERAFPPLTDKFEKYIKASEFFVAHIDINADPLTIHEAEREALSAKARSLVLLSGAFAELSEDFRELVAAGEIIQPSFAPAPSKPFSRKVFIVHGLDAEPKQALARFLEKLAFTPIILQEQPNKGRAIFEKFEHYADVGFAIVLLTPDDTCSNNRKTTKRARQNVILELGYFAGKLVDCSDRKSPD